MRIEERYNKLLELQSSLDERLKDLSFENIKALILESKKNPYFQKLKREDNQLKMLDSFFSMWIEEKKQLEIIGINEDIFDGISSLSDVERKYLSIRYFIFRIENCVPYDLCISAMEGLVSSHVSGIAIGHVICDESLKKIDNAVSIAVMLKNMGETVRAISLLQYMDSRYNNQEKILIELADCWLEGRQWGTALECLKKIENPNSDIVGLIKDLEKMLEQ